MNAVVMRSKPSKQLRLKDGQKVILNIDGVDKTLEIEKSRGVNYFTGLAVKFKDCDKSIVLSEADLILGSLRYIRSQQNEEE